MTLLHDLLGSPDPGPFALLRREGSDRLEVLRGTLRTVARLADLPLPEAAPGEAAGPRTLALVPYRQLAERGFACRDDGTPLACLEITDTAQLDVADAVAQLPDTVPDAEDLGFDIDDDAYRALVAAVLREQIGHGAGSNFVIHRTARARTAADPRHLAAAALRRLLTGERGAYWTFLVHLPGPGGRTLVGASPERHVSVDAGLAMMNPISGTLRHRDVPAGEAGRARLLDFLSDAKEVNELSMVLDEELKMMAVVAERGGQVLGPYLKHMSHLTHTEYLLAGRTDLDVRDVLRETMFAPTLTGSPIENAARVIARYEQAGRRYYGGVLALLGRDADGGQTLDAPILFRCADIDPAGGIEVKAGATLVRDSTPDSEVAETHAKAGGVLTALGLRPAPAGGAHAEVTAYARDPEVAAALAARNERLSSFWLAERSPAPAAAPLAGRSVLIVDAEDTFTGMLGHVLRSLGMRVRIRPSHEVAPGDAEADAADLLVLGPGPGDPADRAEPRVVRLDELIARRLGQRAPLLGVCLGHQVLSLRLGLAMHRRDVPYQGVPRDVDLFGTVRRVGFYSTFTALADTDRLVTPYGAVEVARDADGRVHAVRGAGFAGVQFHPESVLTEDGPALLGELLSTLLPVPRP
ncbi:phenazine-specific anthranilate synthase component I [Catellatospora sp. TT07R-123]|uniref:anthranilate synthase family protein n=1 Tax=Catellatospora sp. TT07R-123 TaxID=2733863 RepID=UPI001B2DB0D4|nr:anthranilate synthase family protein [Catellatospora sp. TT07R-123]GHJ44739.1 phenazine-specific anthranilate synthase component I [Catellatospora sp. TT07R-123]